jgi:DNA-binding transcriptional LysR family regulator
VLNEPLVLAAPSGLDMLTAPGLRCARAAPAPDHLPARDLARPARRHPGVFRAAGITPQIGQEAIQMQTIVSLVSAGMGMALVPQSVSNLMRPGVEYRPLQDATPLVETGLAWRATTVGRAQGFGTAAPQRNAQFWPLQALAHTTPWL